MFFTNCKIQGVFVFKLAGMLVAASPTIATIVLVTSYILLLTGAVKDRRGMTIWLYALVLFSDVLTNA